MPERYGVDSLAYGKFDYAEVHDPDKAKDFFNRRTRRELRGDEWVPTTSDVQIGARLYPLETKCVDNNSYLNGLVEKTMKNFLERDWLNWKR
jgi:hypothetical protein